MDWTWFCLPLAALPAALGAMNLLRMPRLAPASPAPERLVSILIPARDEAANIGPCVAAALASTGVATEVLVMDDGSSDGTAAIVAGLATTEPRLRLLSAPALPPGWTGKVHACARLAEAARGTHLLFIDADVRLAPEAAARLAAHAAEREIGLVARDHHADRLDLVDRRVGRVTPTGGPVEQDLALEAAAEILFELAHVRGQPRARTLPA